MSGIIHRWRRSYPLDRADEELIHNITQPGFVGNGGGRFFFTGVESIAVKVLCVFRPHTRWRCDSLSAVGVLVVGSQVDYNVASLRASRREHLAVLPRPPALPPFPVCI